MNIMTRLVLTVLAVALLPMAAVGYLGLQSMTQVSSLALDESTMALKELGEASIRQTALDVALQVKLFLEARPELLNLPPEQWRTDEALIALAVQSVGETGYTAVYTSDAITHFHANPAIVGMDMHELAEPFPDFWHIFEASLDGSVSAGYYQWKDADGVIREKFMVCAPVGNTGFRVAATTYIDEFYQPIRITESRISQINIDTQSQLGWALVLVGGIAIAIGILLAVLTIRPLNRIADGARKFSQGYLDQEIKVTTRDEIGQLAATFNQMARDLGHTLAEKDRVAHQLQDLNQSLEEKIAERTEELRKSRDEALEARRIAQENSRLKSEFLSTMSHELRTPLNAIEGFTSIMLSGMGIELSPKAEDMVKRVSANSKRLLHLINDFLDLSRIESGRLELVKSPISPSTMARRWQSEVGVLAEEKGIDFALNVDPQLPQTILGDEDALSKIAINLLGNAFKFTQQGQVALDLQRVNGDWTITVSDTGIGIPTHAREYIFEEFRQVDGSSKRLYGGTGLGLSLVQKLTRAMGGNVTLESEVGKGSTFTITLPLETEKGVSA